MEIESILFLLEVKKGAKNQSDFSPPCDFLIESFTIILHIFSFVNPFFISNCQIICFFILHSIVFRLFENLTKNERCFSKYSLENTAHFPAYRVYLLKEDLHFTKTALDCLAYGLHCCCLILTVTDQGDLGTGFDACCHYV